MQNSQRYVVYTALFGHYEKLNEFKVSNRADIDFICLTDNPDLKSDIWKLVQVDSLGLDPHRESRRVKILAHKYLGEYEYSLYIDNSIRLLVDPEEIFSKYLDGSDHSLVCFRHPQRICLYDEAEVVIERCMADEGRVREQVDFYRSMGYPEKAGLISGGFLLRKHNDPELIQLMETWFYHVLRYSRRDQISFNYVARMLGFDFQQIDEDIFSNQLLAVEIEKSARLPSDFVDSDYLWLNPELQRQGIDPRKHYLEKGAKQNLEYRYLKPLVLDQLANRYKTDKGSKYFNRHLYSRVYEYYMKRFRKRAVVLLEIGLLRHDFQAVIEDDQFDQAPSLLMWRDYFRNGLIYGFDIADFSGFQVERCEIIQGDQGNRDDLAKLTETMQRRPMFIIDDGSHASHHQQISLGVLFRSLRPGGIYFIEDLRYQPPQLEPEGAVTTLEVLKEFERTGKFNSPYLTQQEIGYLRRNIETIKFHDSLNYQSEELGSDALVMIRKKGLDE